MLYRKSTSKQQKLSTAGFQTAMYELDSSSSTMEKSEALHATEETVNQITAMVKWPLCRTENLAALGSEDPIKQLSTGNRRD